MFQVFNLIMKYADNCVEKISILRTEKLCEHFLDVILGTRLEQIFCGKLIFYTLKCFKKLSRQTIPVLFIVFKTQINFK